MKIIDIVHFVRQIYIFVGEQLINGISYTNSQYTILSEKSELPILNAIKEFIQSTILNEFSNKLFSRN